MRRPLVVRVLNRRRLRRMQHGYRALGVLILVASVVIAILPVPDLFLLWAGWRLVRTGALKG